MYNARAIVHEMMVPVHVGVENGAHLINVEATEQPLIDEQVQRVVHSRPRNEREVLADLSVHLLRGRVSLGAKHASGYGDPLRGGLYAPFAEQLTEIGLGHGVRLRLIMDYVNSNLRPLT